jgi:hypothetical protein
MLDMGDIGLFSALHCNHALEHIFPHEVDTALREFRRVLTVRVAGRAGDLFWHDLRLLKTHPETMAHRTGFTSAMLKGALLEAGFSKVHMSRVKAFNIMAVAER